MLARRLLQGLAGSSAVTIGYADNPLVDTAPTSGGGGSPPTSTLYTPIADRGTDPYALMVATTPGLVHWWRFTKTYATWGAAVAKPPYWANSAGAGTLWSVAASTPTLGAPLIAGESSGGSVRLNNSSLMGFDYFVSCGSHEVGSYEAWFHPLTLPGDGAIMAAWVGGAGWLLHLASDGTLALTVGGQSISSPAGTIVTGNTYHVVAVVGGTQGAYPDYLSRLYVNGSEVANGSFTAIQQLYYPTAHLFVGQYAEGVADPWDGYVDECAMYSRMLQPGEITDHYNAGT